MNNETMKNEKNSGVSDAAVSETPGPAISVLPSTLFDDYSSFKISQY